MNVKQRRKGTIDDPTLIPSMYDKRLVGCICKCSVEHSKTFPVIFNGIGKIFNGIGKIQYV